MVHAAVSGAIDFSTADLLDRGWWLKLVWTLDRIEDQHLMEVFRLQHAQHTCVLDYTLPRETFETHWDGGNKLIQSIYDLSFPWIKGVKQRPDSKYKDMIAQWRAKFGDTRDPAVKAKIKETAAIMREHVARRRQKAATEKPDTNQQKLRKVIDRRKKGKRKQ